MARSENMCNWLFFSTSYTFSHPRRKILHLEVQDPLYYPLQTVVRLRSILLSHITLCCPTVFLCFSQQYLSNCFNSIFRLLPDLRAPCQAIQEGSLLALPGPASYVAFMAASANVPEMQSRCGQQAFPIYPMTHLPIVIWSSNNHDSIFSLFFLFPINICGWGLGRVLLTERVWDGYWWFLHCTEQLPTYYQRWNTNGKELQIKYTGVPTYISIILHMHPFVV